MACPGTDMESSMNLRSGYGHDSLSSDIEHEPDSGRVRLTRSQFKSFLLLGFYSLPICWFMVCPVFISYEPPHSCRVPSLNDTFVHSFSTAKCSFNETRYTLDENGSLAFNATDSYPDSCPYGVDFGGNDSVADGQESSIVTDWDLVCEDYYYAEVSSMIFIAGIPVGSIIFTPIADRFGRKWVVLIAGWIGSLVGLIICAVDDYSLFCVLRFLQSAFLQGSALIAYTLVIEKLEPRQRNICGIAYNLFWASAMLLLAAMAYLIRNWRGLYLAMCLPTVITVSYKWFVSESIPWLYAKQVRDIQNNIQRSKPQKKPKKKKKEEGDRSPVMGKDGAVEGSSSSNSKRLSLDKATSAQLQQLCNPKILKRLVIVGYLWFVNNLAYYGLSLSTPILAGNLYFNFFLSGLVEIPATLLVMAGISFVGRRVLLCLFFVSGGLALGAIAFLPESAPSYGPIVLFMTGKFAIAGAYAITFLYSQEVFPTIVRSSAVGIVSSFGSIATILAPNAYTLSKIGGVIITNSVFGSTMLVAGLLVLLLPETLNRPLPASLNDL